MNPIGHFMRQDVFKYLEELGLRSNHNYMLFKRLVDEGQIIPVQDRVYRLESSIAKSLQLSLSSQVERVVLHNEKTVFIAKQAIEHLNQVTGRQFRPAVKTTSQINARIKEGAKLEDFIKVIDKKFAEWRGTKQAVFLRPETLFGNRFNSYLNQLDAENKISKMENMNFDKYFGGNK